MSLLNLFSEMFLPLQQALLSSLGSLFVGVLGAFGALSFLRYRGWIESFLLLPGFIPSLFVILTLLSILNPYPFGLSGVVVAHIFTYSGLCAVALLRAIEGLSKEIENAKVFGASRRLTIIKIILPALRADFVKLFALVFAACLTSFSIPLLLSGGADASFEILIYQFVFIKKDYLSALSIAFSQFFLLVLIGRYLNSSQRKISRLTRMDHFVFEYLGFKPFLVFVFLPIGLIFITQFRMLFEGVGVYFALYPEFGFYIVKLLYTLCFVLMVGTISAVWLLVWLWFYPNHKIRSIASCFVSPSSVLIAILILSITPYTLAESSSRSSVFLAAVGFSLLCFITLLNFEWLRFQESLENEVSVAKTMGATRLQIFREILFPRAMPSVLRLSGLVAFWASGDFAFSQLFFGENLTFAMSAKSLAATYRLDAASVAATLGLCIGGSVLLLTRKVSHVFDKKLVS